MNAKIGFVQFRIVLQRLGRAFGHDTPLRQQIAIVGDIERLPDVLLHQEDRDAGSLRRRTILNTSLTKAADSPKDGSSRMMNSVRHEAACHTKHERRCWRGCRQAGCAAFMQKPRENVKQFVEPTVSHGPCRSPASRRRADFRARSCVGTPDCPRVRGNAMSGDAVASVALK